MVFRETKLQGAFVIEPDTYADERGFFCRSWSAREFETHGLASRLAECNISFNKKKGTLRGLHFQAAPFPQSKLVRCTRGAIYDVAVDLRPQSATFKQWVAVNLSAENRLMFFIPGEMAHGFQTMEDDTEIFYQMSERYVPECSRGVRWNDPAFDILWPEGERIMIDRDRNYPDFSG